MSLVSLSFSIETLNLLTKITVNYKKALRQILVAKNSCALLFAYRIRTKGYKPYKTRERSE